MSIDVGELNPEGPTPNDKEVAELSQVLEKCLELAHKFGLDPYPTHFEIVPPSIMYEFGAYLIPGRFSHWSHGKAYYRMKTSYDYGLSKIYEMVINSNPAHAFLMDNNTGVHNKLVIAHVLGHVDFFKHNSYFSHTNRQIVDLATLHAERISKYEYEHGSEEVERFLDAVLSIEEHTDTTLRIKPEDLNQPAKDKKVVADSPYADLWTAEERQKAKDLEKEREKARETKHKFPPQPEKDVLSFIMTYSRQLEDWQRDVIEIVRNEALYFLPQKQTKIMNEGWASLWHQRIMHELDLTDSEYTEYAQTNAGVVSPHPRSLNPYYLGIKMWQDIERRWDNPNEYEREVLKRPGGQGKQKIFEVRELDNDVSFLRNYLTQELIEELDMYVYEKRDNQWVITEKNWEKVRNRIVANMTNFGDPYIMVEDGDYKQNGELYLKHYFEGTPLDVGYAEKTLQNVYQLWGRNVHLETQQDTKRILFSYDGRSNTKRVLT
jgi:stage V sporulation protein R